VATFDCDHRYDARGYQPSDRLRHLVQIRDGTCTFQRVTGWREALGELDIASSSP
jgi:hypothetical protein